MQEDTYDVVVEDDGVEEWYRVAEERLKAPESMIGYQNLAELVQVCELDMCVCLCLCVCVYGSTFGVLGTE